MPIGIYPRLPIIDRFWKKVLKQENGCWEWIGGKTKGYGMFSKNGKNVSAHRLAFEWANGIIPNGMTLDHLCRNHACVNPDHLEIVSVRENILRGIGITARKAKTTHCPKGHPYDLFNTYYTPSGRRDCRTCRHLRKI